MKKKHTSNLPLILAIVALVLSVFSLALQSHLIAEITEAEPERVQIGLLSFELQDDWEVAWNNGDVALIQVADDQYKVWHQVSVRRTTAEAAPDYGQDPVITESGAEIYAGPCPPSRCYIVNLNDQWYDISIPPALGTQPRPENAELWFPDSPLGYEEMDAFIATVQ